MSDVRILIATPTAGRVEGRTSYSITSAVAYLSGRGARTRQDADVYLSLQLQISSVIHSNREFLAGCAAGGKGYLPNADLAVLQALESDFTHILFVDDDVTFEPRAVDILIGRRHPIVGVNTTFKQFPIDFMAVALDGKRRVPTTASSEGLEEVAYMGFGLCLIETRVFRGTPKPWFLPEYIADADTYTTEDNPFFARARKAGFPCLLDHDASKLVGHVGPYEYRWDSAEELKKKQPMPKDITGST